MQKLTDLIDIIKNTKILTENEAKLYEAVLRLKYAKVSKIAREADINRQLSYSLLENIKQKGFIRSMKKNNQMYYQITDPNTVRNEISEYEQNAKSMSGQFNELYPELQKIYNEKFQDTSYITFFQGPKGLLEMYYALCKTEKSGSKMRDLVAWPQSPKTYMQKEYNEFVEWRKKRKIWLKELRIGAAGVELTNLEIQRSLKEVRVLKEMSQFEGANIEIAERKAVIAMWHPNPDKAQGVLISNHYIINVLKILFDIAWNSAKKIDE